MQLSDEEIDLLITWEMEQRAELEAAEEHLKGMQESLECTKIMCKMIRDLAQRKVLYASHERKKQESN